jgi:elongation factor 1-beta
LSIQPRSQQHLADSIHSYGPSQADVKTFQALKSAPEVAKYPHAARWYKHIASFESEFSSLPGDPTKEFTAYGPESAELTVNPSKATANAEEEDDDDVDLFGSDDEEEDAEHARIREERLKEYAAKKAGKVKPAAKSIVTMDVKPWGKFYSNKPQITYRTNQYIRR